MMSRLPPAEAIGFKATSTSKTLVVKMSWFGGIVTENPESCGGRLFARCRFGHFHRKARLLGRMRVIDDACEFVQAKDHQCRSQHSTRDLVEFKTVHEGSDP